MHRRNEVFGNPGLLSPRQKNIAASVTRHKTHNMVFLSVNYVNGSNLSHWRRLSPFFYKNNMWWNLWQLQIPTLLLISKCITKRHKRKKICWDDRCCFFLSRSQEFIIKTEAKFLFCYIFSFMSESKNFINTRKQLRVWFSRQTDGWIKTFRHVGRRRRNRGSREVTAPTTHLWHHHSGTEPRALMSSPDSDGQSKHPTSPPFQIKKKTLLSISWRPSALRANCVLSFLPTELFKRNIFSEKLFFV